MHSEDWCCPHSNVFYRQIRKIIGFSFEKGGRVGAGASSLSWDALKIQNFLIYLHDSSNHTVERYI